MTRAASLPASRTATAALLDAGFLSHDKFLRDLLGPLMLAVPALLGIFWGAPLVARELETGTYRLAWTQSVTRTRWLAVKVALVGLASVAVAGLCQPHGHLVVESDRPREPEPVHARSLRRARHRRDRLRRLRRSRSD